MCPCANNRECSNNTDNSSTPPKYDLDLIDARRPINDKIQEVVAAAQEIRTQTGQFAQKISIEQFYHTNLPGETCT